MYYCAFYLSHLFYYSFSLLYSLKYFLFFNFPVISFYWYIFICMLRINIKFITLSMSNTNYIFITFLQNRKLLEYFDILISPSMHGLLLFCIIIYFYFYITGHNYYCFIESCSFSF